MLEVLEWRLCTKFYFALYVFDRIRNMTFWASGLDNYFICKRFAVKTLLWSMELLIQIYIEHDTIALYLSIKNILDQIWKTFNSNSDLTESENNWLAKANFCTSSRHSSSNFTLKLKAKFRVTKLSNHSTLKGCGES